MKISCGILIGGKSSRMGCNKAFLNIENKTFLQKIAEELKEYDEILVSVDYIEKYRELPYMLVEDSIKAIGPIEGIHQILLQARNEYVFICAVDMPFLKREMVDYITEFISSDYDCYVVCDQKRIHPLCAIYSKKVVSAIEALMEAGQYKLMELLKCVRTKYIRLEQSCFSKKIICNMNTKEELYRWNRPYIFCVSGVKNSGKTGLIERLIAEFKRDYKKIGVIKHDGHEFSMDQEGTDTDRFARAGAVQTAIFSNTQYALLHRKEGVSLENMIDRMEHMDMIIIEGMKGSAYPKIEVVRKGISEECVCDQDTLIAVASNTTVKNKKPELRQIALDDTIEIVDQIKAYFHHHF